MKFKRSRKQQNSKHPICVDKAIKSEENVYASAINNIRTDKNIANNHEKQKLFRPYVAQK